MNIMDILNPVLAIGGMGLLFGGGLGLAAKKFAVPVDERVDQIKGNLPGANCGGCGFAGCEAFAKAVVSGESKPNGCGVCNPDQIGAIAAIMGLVAEIGEKKIAVVKCAGKNSLARTKYAYTGVPTCKDAALVNGGPKGCQYGCLGLGSCVQACPFGAMTVEEGLAQVDEKKCTACGNCVASCPRHLIEVMSCKSSYHVMCHSLEKGKDVKTNCSVGCIGCGLCVKQCEEGAITLQNNVAVIDVEKCSQCGKCKDKCPTNAIIQLN